MHAAIFEEPVEAPAEVAAGVTSTNQFVTFTCGNRAFGIDIMSVREIRSWSPTTELPGQPHGACGVLDIRGSVIEVYDLSALLGGRGTEGMETHVVLVVSMGAENIGILVDSVSDIIFAGKDDLRPVPGSGANSGRAGHVSSLVKHENRLIAILNLSALFPSRAEWMA